MRKLLRALVGCSSIMAFGVGVIGCGEELGEPGDENAPAEAIEQTQSALWASGWEPLAYESQMVGMARESQLRGFKVYTWYDDGWACVGTDLDLCNQGMFQFIAPDEPDLRRIRAIAMALNGNVYTWYNDGTVSKGNTWNLSYYSHKQATPHGCCKEGQDGGEWFGTDMLVEAEIANDGRVYYYWKAGGPKLWRTVGTPTNPNTYSGKLVNGLGTAKQVVVSLNDGGIDAIRGITFRSSGVVYPWGPGPNGSIETWYANGVKNISSSTVNLAKLD